MNSLRLRTGTAVLSVLAAALLAAASPEVSRGLSNCTASQLVPALGDVTVNQGLGNYAYRVRGKDTLVKFFLTNPTTCAVTSTQSINITGATLTVSSAPTGSSPVTAFQSFGGAPAVTAVVSNTSAADPVFAVPSNYLTPTGSDLTFTPTFTATVTYSRKNGTTTTTGLTTTFSNPSNPPVTFDHATRALRVLVVPMGDATQGILANTQFTSTDQTSTQNGFSALSRIFPVPGGVSPLDGTGGIRYAIDLSAMLDLKSVAGAYDLNGKFCGSSGNFDAIKALLAGFMQAWNSKPLNANKQVDRVLGVVGQGISDGADSSGVICADGMASVVSPEAWVRAIADKPAAGRVAAVPSRTGSLMAMELSHTWGGEPAPSTTHHSPNVTADTTNLGRAYNVTTRSYLATNRSVMKYSFVTSPPWDDTLTLLEPADYSYDRCAFGGTTTADCSALGTTTGTTLGVAAGNGFVVSGTVDDTNNTADIIESGFANSLLIGGDDNSLYRYVRRDSTMPNAEPITNIGFHVSFEDTLHNTGTQDDATTHKGLFSFALGDDLPEPGNDLAEVQLWKVSNVNHTNPSTLNGDKLLYDKTQQSSAPQPIGAGKVAKYTDTQFVDEVHPALSDGGGWIAWEAPLVPSVPGSTVIHVAPSTSSANAITLPVPTTDKHIVFESNRDDGDLEIYSMNADGSGQTRLTNSPGFDKMPAASPDGSKIAFVSDRTETDQIFVMDANGGNVQQLTTLGTNAFPTWSPDGTKIAFMSDRNTDTNHRQIWVMNADGTDQHALTTGGDDYYPTWSPDGQKIAFASTRGGGNSQIWVANSDGSGPLTQLTTASSGPPIHDQPSWSTDGSKIAFSGGSSSSAYDVYVMNTDGSGQTNLTNNAADDRIASWSPDGSKIAFTSNRAGNYDVYVMNAGGGGVTQVTTNAAADSSSSWSPARDTGLTDAFPAWKPSTDAIAYAFHGDLYTQSLSFPGGVPSAAGDPIRIYTAGDGELGPPAAHHPSWSLNGNSIAFDAAGDIYTIPAAGGSPTQLTNNAEAEHDPSWSHTAGDNRIAYVRGPLGPCTPSTKLYVVDPVTDTQDKVGDEGCGLFPSFGTNGRIAFLKPDGNIWSAAPDGTTEKQLTVSGQDSFPSAAGNMLAFDRLFSACPLVIDEECFDTQLDIMLMSSIGTNSFSAESNVPLKADVFHEVNGTAYPVYVGLNPDQVDGAIQTWHINFDGSNAPSGGVLKIRFTDGVQYVDGGTVFAPTVAPKPPTAAIYSPLDTTYSYRATLALSGTGYDAEGNVLPESSLHWTLTLPNGTPYPLPNGGNFASTDLQPPAAGWPGGTFTFTLVASDGTLSSAPVTRKLVVVAYDFVGAGFLSPIANPPGVNTGKPGAQFPMKWQLKSPSGKFVSDLGTVKAVEYQTDGNPPTCTFSSAMGPRVALPNGGTALRYDTKNNQFVYNWTTPTSPGCYVFTLTLSDGTEHQAYFKLS
jgi:Tol biopolymer transport system component